MINVTKSYLPPLKEYISYLEGIWDRNWLTNQGPLLTELEDRLKKYLGVKHLFIVNNGTIALQIAIKAVAARNRIVTTPFSYVATASSVAWEGCETIFCDITPDYLQMDIREMEHILQSGGVDAIVATHVYGYPCDVEAISILARKYKTQVIYDAAHAFGVKYKDTSLLNYGDVSTLSFHATKLFHTIEGGALVTSNDEIAEKIFRMRNFGHKDANHFMGVGINGKSSEFNAAMGLCILPQVDEFIRQRGILSDLYDSLLKCKNVIRPVIRKDTEQNYSYYPVIFNSEADLLRIVDSLLKNNISARRYFHPSLNTLDYFKKQSCPQSEDIAKRVLCLPLYPGLAHSDVEHICKITES